MVLLVNLSLNKNVAATPEVGTVAFPPSGVSPTAIDLRVTLYVDAATDVPLVANVKLIARSLQTDLLRLPKTGSGFTVCLTTSGSPKHPNELTGTTVYETSNEVDPLFWYVSVAR